jgi:DNA polymerase III alpha subunit
MDVDIDCPTSFKPEDVFPWVRASILRDGALSPHPCGYYPQMMAKDPFTGLAAAPYDRAEEEGFMKVDFLHLRLLDGLTRPQIEEWVRKEPDWDLLLLPSVQTQLFQLAKHGDLLTKVRPRSVEELADCMALIRPGKKKLLGLYLKDRAACRPLLYIKDEDYSFKKSHALAYSYNVVLQLHRLQLSGVNPG